MSKAEKQKYLNENILQENYSPEIFIEFLEEKREDGGDVDSWTLEELEEVVLEFKNIIAKQKENPERKNSDEEDVEKMFPTTVQRIKTFGAGRAFRYDSSDSEDEEKEKIKDHQEIQFMKENWDQEKFEEDQKKLKELEEVKKNNEEKNHETIDQKDNKSDESVEIKSDRYYSRKEGKSFEKNELIDVKDIKVEVSDPEEVKTGILVNNYTVFTVKTQPFNWNVKRRYRDFEWLHKSLHRRFSAHYVKNLKLFFRFLHCLIKNIEEK